MTYIKCDKCGKTIDPLSTEWTNCEVCGDDLCESCMRDHLCRPENVIQKRTENNLERSK